MKSSVLRLHAFLLMTLLLTGAICQAQSAPNNLRNILQPMVQNSLEGPRYFAASLVKQGYKESDVLAACNVLDVDWNARATQAADYAATKMDGGCSQLSIAKLLANIGYTNDQILYALSNCSIDWHYQAWRDARSFAEKQGGNASDEQIKAFLQKFGYSKDQIEYACRNRLDDNPLE